MTVMPTGEGFMIPTLRVLSDGVVRTRRDLCTRVAQVVGLTDVQVKETYNVAEVDEDFFA